MDNCKCCPKECWNKILDKTIGAIGTLLFVVFILLFVMIVIIIVQTICSDGVKLLFSKEGVKNMIDFWTEYKAVLIALFSVSTLFIANRQFTKYLKEYEKHGYIEETKAITEIRKLLDTCEDNFKIHTELEEQTYQFPEEVSEQVICFRYLGTIELASAMVQKNIITVEQFKRQFGYRVENIFACESLRTYLNGHDKPYWKDLHWINREMNYN